MSITDELRHEVANYPFRDNRDFALFEAIADRIDAEHERVVRERRRSCVYYDPERHYCSCHDFDVSGYVELPKDADGEYIHIGDVMEGVDKYDTLKKVKGNVITVSFESDGAVDVAVQAWNSDGKSWHRAYLDPDASVYRHHHAPTVEDVLREFAYGLSVPVADSYVAATAAKLRLAESEDA